MTDRTEIIPVYAGSIICKILCMDNMKTVQRSSRLKLKRNVDKGEEGAAVARARILSIEQKTSLDRERDRNTSNGNNRPVPRYSDHHDQQHNQEEEGSEEEEDNFQEAPQVSQPPKPQDKNSRPPSERKPTIVNNLLDNDEIESRVNVSSKKSAAPIPKPPLQKQPTSPPIASIPKAAPITPPRSAPTPPPIAPVTPVQQEQDMFHFEADSKSSKGQGLSNPSKNSSSAGMSREELVTRREAAVEEKVKEALEYKHELDENNKKESEELDTARGKHDKTLTNWSTNNKEKRNVRSLLTTMHTVLWTGKGNNWKTIGLGDVIEPKQVKLQYRKAMLVVHPDRCSALDTETKFIAKRIFEGINEAYQEFLKKESV
jgi:hypothetical protein